MAIFKCKMCGGNLNLTEDVSTAECEYCGSLQTVPKADDDKKLTLFARANRLRSGCEFDKAAGIYEAIVADFPEEPEAYWGLVLCKYGIEYVDDPATGKKIPTCHRSGFESVMKDQNVELAQEYADVMARRLYREEAKQIEELRKDIIEVSAKEKPYDVFLCYKETDFDGKRTLDSVLAMDIYKALSDEDYRVFFSRISLEDKLGTEYEPYIFAALNSAKIMLVVGTDYEHFNAVWVKNEWSRFLKLMAQDKTRHLIPCYKDIDAYDMPEEFVRLQAQDLNKMGAIQDIVHGVQKLLPKQDAVITEKVIVQKPTASAPSAESLLERAFMFLEDGKWADANTYCERVLDIDPKCAQAYLAKLMAELKIRKKESLQDHIEQILKNSNYKKILRFGDQELCELLRSFEQQYTREKQEKEEQLARERQEKEEQLARERQEEEEQLARERQEKEEQLARERQVRIEKQKLASYNLAKKCLEQGMRDEAYSYLRELSGYQDADALLESIQKDIHSVLARVKLNGKYGFINEAGEMVIKPQFEDAGYFASNGLARVKLNGKYGFINEAGETVIRPQFEEADEFASNGLAPVKLNGKWGFINEAGETVIKPQFDDAYSFASNGLASVELNGKCGFINEAGEMVIIKPQFDRAGNFASNGLASVVLNGKYGFINEAGETVIRPQFERIDDFASNGLMRVELNGKWGFINEAGEMVITPQYKWAYSFASNGLASVKLNGKCGFINEAGEMVIKPQFEGACSFASNGLASVELNDKWGFINEAGEMVIKPQFEWSETFASNGLAAVQQDGKYGYINEAGEMVIKPQFDLGDIWDIEFASNGLASVQLNGKWGVINEAGEMVIKPQFEEVDPFHIIFRSEVDRVAEKNRIAQEKAQQQATWRAAGRCQHCGGILKGFFTKKCTSCEKPKDY